LAREEKHFQMDLDEVTLHWTEVGEGLPVLLLHGLSDSHRTWREIWPRLPGRRVLMLDLPGHGMSSRPDAPYTLDWNATQVARFIEQLDLRNLDSGPRADQTRAFRVQCRRENCTLLRAAWWACFGAKVEPTRRRWVRLAASSEGAKRPRRGR